MKPNGTFIMQQDNKSERLWVRNDGFWNVLRYDFGMEYIDIQTLVYSMVERAFKLKVSTPITMFKALEIRVESAFKHKVSTPIDSPIELLSIIEKSFKNKIIL